MEQRVHDAVGESLSLQDLQESLNDFHKLSEDEAGTKGKYALDDPLRTIRYIQATISRKTDLNSLNCILAVAYWQMTNYEKRMLMIRLAAGFFIMVCGILAACFVELRNKEPGIALLCTIGFAAIAIFARECKDFLLDNEKRFRDAWSNLINDSLRRRHELDQKVKS